MEKKNQRVIECHVCESHRLNLIGFRLTAHEWEIEADGTVDYSVCPTMRDLDPPDFYVECQRCGSQYRYQAEPVDEDGQVEEITELVLEIPELDRRFSGYTVSKATLRTSDLIIAFLRFLRRHWKPKADKIVKSYDLEDEFDLTVSDELQDVVMEKWVENNPEVADYIMDELFDALNDIAPPGHVFGACEGNASDFGFWRYAEDEWI